MSQKYSVFNKKKKKLNLKILENTLVFILFKIYI